MAKTEQLEQLSRTGESGASITLSERLAAEGQLLQSVPERTAHALQDRWRQVEHNPQQLTVELGGAIAVGCVAGLVTKNPALLGESLAPVVAAAQRYAGAVLFGASVGDITCKTAVPMAKTWTNPSSLPYTKEELGRNFGNAAFDYSTTFIGGGLGFAAGHRAASLFESPVLLAKDLPLSVTLTGNVEESKIRSGFKVGDVLVTQFETANREAVRFGTKVNVGDSRWENLDIYDSCLHHTFHALNTFQLNKKRPVFLEYVAQQAGREARPYFGGEDGRPQYMLVNGVLLPKDYCGLRIPEHLKMRGAVHIGPQRPKHDAQSIPASGTVWLKFEERKDIPTSNDRKPTDIVPRVSTRHGYFPLRTSRFGKLAFESAMQAEEVAAEIKASLGEHAGEPLHLTYIDGHRSYVFGSGR